MTLIVLDAQETVRRMLCPNPRRRITAPKLLEDEWICSYMS